MTTDVENPPILDPLGTAYILDPARPVLTQGREIAAGRMIREHSHPRGQLLWAMSGVVKVTSHACVWVVPPSHAVWVPGDLPHRFATETDAEMLNLYVDPSRPVRQGRGLGGQGCAVLELTPFVRELILRLAERLATGIYDRQALHLAEVALDELEGLKEAPLSLPGGQDPRLVRMTRYLAANPADMRPLADLGRMVAVAPRTLERLFRAETGLSFGQWRNRLRLLAAIDALNRGESSTSIAFSLGWNSPSAFVAAFRTQFGTTPQRFLQEGRAAA
ncbi:helix-turn-helix transcriptional regulator [Rhodobacter sp.]